jgi:hypothetical protein
MHQEGSSDDIVERATVDAYGDEGHEAFPCAFDDEVEFPIEATLAGGRVTTTCVENDGDEGRGLVAGVTNGTGGTGSGSSNSTSKTATPPRSLTPSDAGSV